MRTLSLKKMKSKIIIVMFASVFAIGFGIGGWFGIKTLALQIWQVVETRNWQPVSATVLAADLVTQKKTSRVTARYRYRVNGRDYEGTRIGSTDGSDNIGRWHHDQYQLLARAKRNSSAIQVWVDPDHPERTLVDRNIRWAMVAFSIPFAILFPLISLGACWVIYRTLRVPTTGGSDGFKAYRNAYGIQSNASTKMRGAWAWALAWNLLWFPIMFVLFSSIKEFPSPALLFLIFPFLGLLLVWDAVKKTMRWQQHGDVTLTLSPPQPSLGNNINVAARFSRVPPAGNFTVALICEEVDGRGESTVHRTAWRQERVVRTSAATVNASFLPRTNVPATEAEGTRYHRWRVLVRFPDGKDEREFNIVVSPARAEEAMMPDATPDVMAEATATQPIPPTLATVNETMSKLHIEFGTANQRGAAIFTLIFGVIFIGVGCFLVFGDLTRGSMMPKMMGFIFAVVGFAIAGYSAYAFTHRRTVEIAQGRVRVANRWLAKSSVTEFAVRDVQALSSKITGTTTVGTTRHDHHEISAVLRDGRAIELASDVRDLGVAESLKQLFQRRLVDAETGERPLSSASMVSEPTEPTPADVARALQIRKQITLGVKILGGLMFVAFFWDAFGSFLDVGKERAVATPQVTKPAPIANLGTAEEAMFTAVNRGDGAALASALASGANINATNNWGATALIVAVGEGAVSEAVVQQLISAGADVNFTITADAKYRGRTALMAAALASHSSTIPTLLKANADAEKFDRHGWSALHYAAYAGDINSLTAFHRHAIKLDLMSPASRGESPLMLAARYGKLNVIRDLIELGADPRLKDRHGENTYGWAKFFKQDAAMEMLKQYQ